MIGGEAEASAGWLKFGQWYVTPSSIFIFSHGFFSSVFSVFPPGCMWIRQSFFIFIFFLWILLFSLSVWIVMVRQSFFIFPWILFFPPGLNMQYVQHATRYKCHVTCGYISPSSSSSSSYQFSSFLLDWICIWVCSTCHQVQVGRRTWGSSLPAWTQVVEPIGLNLISF